MRADPGGVPLDDLFVVSISACWRARGRLWPLLSPSENAHLERFARLARRKEWLAGRIAAKGAASQFLGLRPDRLVIETGVRGQPLVHVDGAAASGCHVSISHCDDLAVACCDRRRVGLDVQLSDDGVEPSDWLSPKERAAIEPLGPRARKRALLDAWCAREALAKWRGTGLSLPLTTFAIPTEATLSTGSITFGGRAGRWARVGSAAA